MQAPGGPGAPPSSGPGRKDAFGTSPGHQSKVWFTLASGNLTEVFYPTLDRPALRSLRFLVAARGSPPVDDAVDAEHQTRWAEPGVPAFSVESTHPEYRLRTEWCCDVALNAVLVSGDYRPELPDVRLFLQWSPFLRPGSTNSAFVLDREPPTLVAEQDGVWIAVVGPFERASAGYVNSSDLFVDLHDSDGEMTQLYDSALSGNVALGAELGIRSGPFQLAIGFGQSRPDAEETALEALHKGFAQTRADLEHAWRVQSDLPPNLLKTAGDGGALARASLTVLRSLEDKTHPGAWVAAPAAPWGELQADGDQVYHLVWPRDLCQVATALVDLGEKEAGCRALRYLESRQRPDGSWPQNFDLEGNPHWDGQELDEVAWPVLLAWRLGVAGVLDHDPYPGLVRRAVRHLVTRGPATALDRWEDGGGFSPSTLALEIAALVAAAELADDSGEHLAGAHLRAVADYWNDRVEAWTLAPGGHYLRLAGTGQLGPDFLDLVRRGLRAPADPRITASLAAVDRELRAELPTGAGWRRFTGDTYGESDSGQGWTKGRDRDGGHRGRPWPLLTGERAFHELALGRPALELVESIEGFAGPELLIPEQVWDGPPLPGADLKPGRPTNSARPLGWAHAEYLRLLAAIATGSLPDVVQPARRRYLGAEPAEPACVWSHAHQVTEIPPGRRVKVQLERPGHVLWTADAWATRAEIAARDAGLGLWVAELPTAIMRPGAGLDWTVRYEDGWEGSNYRLTCVQ